jgi:hypothetical protein
MQIAKKLGCLECHGQAHDRGATDDEAEEESIRAFDGTSITTASDQIVRCKAGHNTAMTIYDAGYAMLYERALQP